MKVLLALGIALLAVGAIFTFTDLASGWGLLLMLISLPPIFLGIFLGLLRDSDADQ